MLSTISSYILNLGTLILGLLGLGLIFNVLRGLSRELDFLQEISNVPNDRKL